MTTHSSPGGEEVERFACVVGMEGVEPSPRGPKPRMIPFHYTPER